jgi:hypothetical protein
MMRSLRCLVMASLLALAACDDESPQEDRAARDEIAALRDQIQDLESELAKSDDNLAKAQAQLEENDRDALAALAAAEGDRERLQGLLDDAKDALAEAEAELAGQDYEEALEELTKAREALEQVTLARAQMPGSVELDVNFMFGDDALELERSYEVAGGSVSFKALRYWLTNVSLIDENDEEVALPNSYHLMEVRGDMFIPHVGKTAPARRREQVNLAAVPPGSYKGVVFHVGVDAEHNDDLSKASGELNVLSTLVGVAWHWFTSWIFTSTTATYVPSDAAESDPAIILSWDNGSNADYRRVEVDFGREVIVDLVSRPVVELEFQAEQLFEGLDPETAGYTGG